MSNGDIRKVIDIILQVSKKGLEAFADASGDVKSLTKDLKSLETQLKQVEEFKKLKTEVNASSQAFKTAQDEVKRLATEIKSSSQPSKQLVSDFEKAQKNAKSLKDEFTKNQQALQKLRTSLKDAGVDTKNLASEEKRLKTELGQLEKELKDVAAVDLSFKELNVRPVQEIKDEVKKTVKALDDLKASGKATGNEIKRASTTASQKIKELQKEVYGVEEAARKLGEEFRGFLKVTAAVAAIHFPVKEAATFERKMAEVQAVSGATAEQLQRMEAEARRLGASTEFSATQAAEGLRFLSMAGFEAEESIQALGTVLNVAQAGSLELGEAADIVTNVMTSFNFKANETERIADALTQTFTSTNSTLRELGEGFAYVGALAKSAGVEFEELTAALGLLHNAGIKGSMAGTTLRGALARLLSPTKEEAALMTELSDRLGGTALKVTDAQGKFVGFRKILKQFEDAGIGASEAIDLLGVRAGPGIAALLQQGTAALNEMTDANEKAEGRAKVIAKVMGENVVGATRELKSALQELVLAVYGEQLPAFEDLIRDLAKLVQQFGDWLKTNEETTKQVVRAVLVISELAAVVAAAKLAFAALNLGLKTFQALAGAAFIKSAAKAGATVSGVATEAAAATTSVGGLGAGLKKLSGQALALTAAGGAGWAVGRMLGEWKVGFDESGRTIDEFVQTGMAKIGEFFANIRGESGETFRRVQEDIKAEAELRGALAELKALEASKEIALRDTIAERTKEIDEIIKETQERFNELQENLTNAVKRYSSLFEATEENVKKLGEEAKKEADRMWEDIYGSDRIAQLQKALTEVEVAWTDSAINRAEAIARIERQISNEQLSAVRDTLDKTIGLLDEDFEKRKSLAEERLTYEISKINAETEYYEENLERKEKAEEQHAKKIREIELETLNAKKKYYKQAASALKSQLDEARSLEKEHQGNIESYQKELLEHERKTNEERREFRREEMGEQEKWFDERKELQDDLSKAESLLNSSRKEDLEEAQRLYEQVQDKAKNLNREVVEGNRVQISATEARETALKLFEEGAEGVRRALEHLIRQEETQKEQWAEVGDAADDSLSTVLEKLQEVDQKAKEGFEVKVTAKTDEFDKQMSLLEQERESVIKIIPDHVEASKALDDLRNKRDILKEIVTMDIEARFGPGIERLENILLQRKDLIENGLIFDADLRDQASEKLEAIQKKVKELDSEITDKEKAEGRKYVITFKGFNPKEEGLEEKIKHVSDQINILDKTFGKEAPDRSYVVTFTTPQNRGVVDEIHTIETEIKGLDALVEGFVGEREFTIAFKGKSGIEEKGLYEATKETEDSFKGLAEDLAKSSGEYLVSFLGTLQTREGAITLAAALGQVTSDFQNLSADLAQPHPYNADFQQAVAALNTFLELYNTAKTSVEVTPIKILVDISQALDAIAQVKSALDSIPREIITIHRTIHVGEGSSELPITEKLAQIDKLFDDLRDNIEAGADFMVHFAGAGDLAGGTKELQQIQDGFNELLDTIEQGDLGTADLGMSFQYVIDQMENAKDQISLLSDELTQAVSSDREEELAAWKSCHNAIAEGAEEAVARGIEAYQNMADDIQGIQDRILRIEETTAQRMRRVQQNTMTEEEKWLDDREEANRLYNEAVKAANEGRLDDAADLFDESQALAATLSREVRDEQGEIVRSVEDTTKIALRLMEKAGEKSADVFKETQAEMESAQKRITDGINSQLETMTSLVEAYAGKLHELYAEMQRVQDAQKAAVEETPVPRSFSPSSTGSGGGGSVSASIEGIGKAYNQAAGELKDSFRSFSASSSSTAKAAQSAIESVADSTMETVGDTITTTGEQVSSALTGMEQDLKMFANSIQDMFALDFDTGGVENLGTALSQTVKGVIDNVPTPSLSYGGNPITGLLPDAYGATTLQSSLGQWDLSKKVEVTLNVGGKKFAGIFSEEDALAFAQTLEQAQGSAL